jgi:hypothetical protein
MKKFQSSLVLIVVLAAAMMTATSAQAQSAACTGGQVSGTIVAVDETTGTVTVDTGGGATCTVTLNGNTSHPIASLLGKYFGDISSASLTEALKATQGCAQVSGGSGAWSSCDAPGATPVQVVSANPDGTFTAQITNPDGSITTIILTVEEAAALDNINQALAKLAVAWTLDEFGDLVQVSDQIMAYHEQGVGFGVLVKLYSLSNASGIPVADLLAQFQAGTGMGELFKTYGGKPPETGVGHVKQALNSTTTTTQTNNGNHYGQNNNGGNSQTNNGNAYGHDKPKKPKK